MRKAVIATVIVAAVATSGCAVFKSKANATPDEFAVARNAPLVIPPDFALTPPVAGTAGLSPADAQQQAIDGEPPRGKEASVTAAYQHVHSPSRSSGCPAKRRPL